MNVRIPKDQALAYLCRLIVDFEKDNPTQAEAEKYFQTEFKVTLKDVMEVLDAASWQDCLNIYYREVESRNPNGHSHNGKRYSRRELAQALNELWVEFKGEITQAKVINRTKTKPTPSWNTLIRHFGQPSTWAEFIDPEILKLVPPQIKKTLFELKITIPNLPEPIIIEFTEK